MLRLLAIIFLAFMALGPAPAAKEKTNQELYRIVNASLVIVQVPKTEDPTSSDSTCGGVVVDTFNGRVLTAEHCVVEGRPVVVDGAPSEIIRKDDEFALVSIPPTTKPAIALATREPDYGDDIIGMGFGYGFKTFMARSVAQLVGGMIGVDGLFAPGMSGGPMVNRQGELVGIVQMNVSGPFYTLGVGSGLDRIKAFLKK
jgi:S1-C subfamily serine protease